MVIVVNRDLSPKQQRRHTFPPKHPIQKRRWRLRDGATTDVRTSGKLRKSTPCILFMLFPERIAPLERLKILLQSLATCSFIILISHNIYSLEQYQAIITYGELKVSMGCSKGTTLIVLKLSIILLLKFFTCDLRTHLQSICISYKLEMEDE
ncbi:uncharacterized protein LOC130726726 [Lotus japonicus]|uniref:uncharacterized protein LOC130726726 n=1 Tax=Lotus japonicus TaxID=34305 RepID=UPI00258CF559|nr:uncharacterized protein LOC130726726 [Lotus japonicus]XP_057434008.1 uncharacterized protein LOC130726726 [Lotus japonicus]